MEDFKYDFSNVIKRKWPLHENEYIDKLIKSYLFTHQFSEDIKISENDILGIFEYFLEDNEMVFVNNNKYLFIINCNHNITEIITFIKNIFKFLSIKVIDYNQNPYNDQIILTLSIRHYENTFNGRRIEELYCQ